MQNIELANFSIIIRNTLQRIHWNTQDLYQLYIFFVWVHCELEVQQNNMRGINSCFESWMCYFENLSYLLMAS